MKITNLNRLPRLAISALVSVLIIISATWFIKPSIHNQVEFNEEILAVLISRTRDVQSKQTDQVLWREARIGQELYRGELLRTAPESSAIIKLHSSDALINLGPETTIVLTDRRQGTEFEIFEGDLLIESLGNEIAFNHSGRKIEIDKAQVNIDARSDGQMDLEVLAGQATVEGRLAKSSERLILRDNEINIEATSFKFKKPKLDADIVLSPVDQELRVEWEDHLKAYEYQFYLGRTRQDLASVEILESSPGHLKVKVPSGIFFWKVIGRDNSNNLIESSTNKSHFIVPLPPLLISPIDQEEVFIKPGESIELRFNQRSIKGSAYLEIAKDALFSSEHEVFQLEDSQEKFQIDNQPEGVFYWRVFGEQADDERSLFTEVRSFKTTFSTNVNPPMHLFPSNNSVFFEDDFMSISLGWRSVKEAEEYLLEISNKRDFGFEKNIKATNTTIEKLKQDTYYWRLAIIDSSGMKSEFSDAQTFIIKSLPKIEFKDFSRIVYFDPYETYLTVDWISNPEVDRYEVFIKHSDFGEKIINTLNTSERIRVSKTGSALVQVSGFISEKLVARSNMIEMQIINHPLPDSPKWLMDDRDSVSDGQGNIDLYFQTISDAAHYLVEVRDLSSRILRVEQINTSPSTIRDLYPGDYLLYLRSVDQHNRRSELAQPFRINVPKTSDLERPVLKRINIR